MAKSRQQKEVMLRDIEESLKKSKSVVFTINKGIKAEEMVNLRNAMFKNNARYEVSKKTLLRIALKNANIELPNEAAFLGPINTAYSYEDEIIGPKTIHDFAKNSEHIEIVGGIYEGVFLTKEQVISLATMPSKEELLAKLVGSMNAPVSGFVNCMANGMRKIARVVNALKEKKEATA